MDFPVVLVVDHLTRVLLVHPALVIHLQHRHLKVILVGKVLVPEVVEVAEHPRWVLMAALVVKVVLVQQIL